MKNTDKIVAAFLVSAGFFSMANASKYVAGLSEGQKSEFCALAAAEPSPANSPAPGDDSPLRLPVPKKVIG